MAANQFVSFSHDAIDQFFDRRGVVAYALFYFSKCAIECSQDAGKSIGTMVLPMVLRDFCGRQGPEVRTEARLRADRRTQCACRVRAEGPIPSSHPEQISPVTFIELTFLVNLDSARSL